MLISQAHPFIHSLIGYLLKSGNYSLDRLDVNDSNGVKETPLSEESQLSRSGDEDVNTFREPKGGQYTGNNESVNKEMREEPGTDGNMNNAQEFPALYGLITRYENLPHYKHSLELLLYQELKVQH